MRYQSIIRDYEEQQEALDQLHEREGKDTFVASYTATQNEETGTASIYCVWSKGVPTLLPETDVVHFFNNDDDVPEDEQIVATAPWDRVREIVGDLMTRQEMCPPRSLVDAFPIREQVKALIRG